MELGGCVHSTQLVVHIVHSTLGGSRGKLPQENFRVFLRPWRPPNNRIFIALGVHLR